MFLIVSATQTEIGPLQEALVDFDRDLRFLISGVGPVETALNLTRYLSDNRLNEISSVINIGLAGAYPDSGLELLDICLAEKEHFGDIGINISEKIEPLDKSFAPQTEFSFNRSMLINAKTILDDSGIKYRTGNFVTVSSSSGTISRGRYLQDKFEAICENMEGAAVARVCSDFSLPCLQVRCVSNLVLDREEQHWLASEAAASCAAAVKIILEGLLVD